MGSSNRGRDFDEAEKIHEHQSDVFPKRPFGYGRPIAVNLRIPGVSIDLDSAASRVFAVLGASAWEQRLSSHYLDERYFRASIDGFWVCVALSDEVVEGYPFIAWVDAVPEAPKLRQAEFERNVRVKLSAAGLDISE